MDEDIDLDDVSLNEQIEFLIEDLPEPIQKFIRSPRRNEISLELSRKYSLHTDKAGVFERAYIFMLLGVFTPDEFVQDLRDEGFEETTIKGLAADVNEEVFKKLRDEERALSIPAQEPYRSQAPATSVPVMNIGEGSEEPLPSVSTPTKSSERAAAPSPVFERPAYEPAQIATPIYSHASELVAPTLPTMAPTTAINPIGSVPPQNEPYLPYARTMAEDMERAAHGLTGTPASPARSFQTASVPVTFAQPQAIQAPMPTQPAPQAAPSYTQPPYVQPAQPTYPPVTQPSTPEPVTMSYQPQFSAPQQVPVPNYATPTPPPAPVMAPVRLTPVDRSYGPNAPITKEYGSDPYREPISI